MDKTLQQIKDEWAKDHGYIDYKEFYELTRAVDTYQVFIMDGAVNQISIRYAQEQNKELVEMLTDCEEWIGNCNQYTPILKRIEKLIIKHKGR